MVFNLPTFSFSESGEDDQTPPKSFSLNELQVATHNFSSNNIVDVGFVGEVYRGRLADGSLVAVKRAYHVNQHSKELLDAEMEVVSTVSTRPNVLCLRGFCGTKKELLLVYPLMINNSLSYNLRRRPDRFAQPLDWTTRKQIALGVARALAHLHNQGNVKIMHRQICTSNILLNAHFEAMIGGFSFAMIMHERNVEQGTIEWPVCMRWQGTGVSFSSPIQDKPADSGSDAQSYHRYEDVYVNTTVRGRDGFIAPEYLGTEKCTLKNDVFAYGRMSLELILGQPISELSRLSNHENFHLNEWIGDFMNKNELGSVTSQNLPGWGMTQPSFHPKDAASNHPKVP